ncbi:LytTR family DNA-binding domain-containing protein [Hyphobacterium sp.]|jgi:hypothetical protein|uniref:LytTR family DNA-binding domain-containing protein n=1 Tax=Hyphobacterium sp. TaxID=2004662 RepID=UPI003BA9F97B
MIRAVLLVFVFLLAGGPAAAQLAEPLVRICPAGDETEPPDFQSEVCESGLLFEVDPQGRMIWVEFYINLSPEAVMREGPTGLYVSAAASSSAFMNGVPLGSNGTPGINRASETPGQMDTIFFVPPQALQTGLNRIAMKMSSHHGPITFSYPLHQVTMGRYTSAQERILQAYLPALFPLGAFILGILIFGFRALASDQREAALILLAVSLFASLQLLAETSRGYYAYPYPFHGIRMILVLIGAAGLALMMLAHTIHRFLDVSAGWRWLGWSGYAVLILAIVLIVPAFDPKTAIALLLPLLASLIISVWAVFKRRPVAIGYAGFFLLAVILLVWRPNLALDIGIFYLTAGFIIFLLVEQAAALIRARQTLLEERDRASRLELALERARQKDVPSEIQLTSAGKIHRLSADRIVSLKAAGDYVELALSGGRSELFSLTLSEAETRLPDTFLRIHRSHIVNTDYVKTLTRAASGVGELELTDGTVLPVSRRIMPKVRSVLRD